MADPVIETTTTEKKSGDVAITTPAAPPPVVADDNARKILAIVVILQFLILVAYIINVGKTNDNQLLLGAEISFVTTVLNYYFGSSSGSTAKTLMGGR